MAGDAPAVARHDLGLAAPAVARVLAGPVDAPLLARGRGEQRLSDGGAREVGAEIHEEEAVGGSGTEPADGPVTHDIPVVAVTAFTRSRDRPRARSLGCASYLPKPCEPSRLLEEVRRLIGPAERRASQYCATVVMMR